eukprot:TRINITY_DN4585_c0_g1_i1.p1 TRINITY_DN4585_c0_g1~~TRINITY_DN4585_c0_g1_i1.p1  ORF type:complete len:288 (-),score=49.54 TRINITY_DN4585_c0_g1_i1:171-1034(-)
MGNALKKDLIGGTFLAPHTPPLQTHQGPHSSGTSHQIIVEHRNCVPLGLYPTCEWDTRIVKKLIIDKKLAPIFKGHEEKISPEYDECPICFYFYPGGLNRSTCCKQPICTECYLQVKKPNTTQGSCPFCNMDRYHVHYLGPKSKEERLKEAEEERRVTEAQERMRREEEEEDRRREQERLQRKAEAAATAAEKSPAVPIPTHLAKEAKRSQRTIKSSDDEEEDASIEVEGESEKKEVILTFDLFQRVLLLLTYHQRKVTDLLLSSHPIFAITSVRNHGETTHQTWKS